MNASVKMLLPGLRLNVRALLMHLYFARDGDTIVVTQFDCLGRTTLDTLRTARDLDQRNIKLQALDIATSTQAGRLVLKKIASLAE